MMRRERLIVALAATIVTCSQAVDAGCERRIYW